VGGARSLRKKVGELKPMRPTGSATYEPA